jgi:hypothetical protein
MKPFVALCVLAALSVTPLAHGGALRPYPPDPAGGTGGGPIAGSVHVRVVRAGTTTPLPGAFVMVGTMPGAYFAGNYGVTSGSGEITFSHPSLHGPLMVTAGAAGMRYFTLDSVDANDLVIPLSPAAPSGPTYSVGDAVTGIDVNNGIFHAGDGNLDMAVVIPALRMEDLMGFDAARFFGTPDTINVLGTPVPVPSNCYIPQQWEVFIEIIKDHYSLFLPEGSYTLAAISGRIPNDAVLSGAPMEELLPSIQWKETDVLNVTITGNTTTADLNVDPDLVSTVTLNLANIPDGSTAYCMSLGDLDNLSGLGRVVPLGMNSLNCPAGSGPCSGSVPLTTTAASGEFAGMGYFPAVAVASAASEDALVLLGRGPHAQTYVESMASFFRPLDLAYADGRFDWSDAANPVDGSPAVALQQAVLRNATGDSLLWEFLLPGDRLTLIPPTLPPSAPPAPVAGFPYRWEQRSIGLGYDLPVFDFDAFAFSDILAHVSHAAADRLDVLLSYPAADAPDEVQDTPGLSLHVVGANPVGAEAILRCTLAASSAVDLSILTADGRAVATLAQGSLPAGIHDVRWSARDADGRPLPNGIYFARLRADGKAAVTRILVLH